MHRFCFATASYSQNRSLAQPPSSLDDELEQGSPTWARGWQVAGTPRQRRDSRHGAVDEQAWPGCRLGWHPRDESQNSEAAQGTPGSRRQLPPIGSGSRQTRSVLQW
jgi:hypothetical protein